MGVRLTGLNSGMDTESMIKKIMDAQRTKLNKIEGKRTTLDWKKEKWKDLNTKLYSLYTSKISSLRFSGAYTTKRVTSSDENVVKVKGDPSAVDGAHKIQVKQTAKTQTLTGAKVADGIDKNSVLTDICFDLGEEITFKTGEWANKEITPDNEAEAMASGKVHKFEINGDTTVNELLDAAKKAGINASFDDKQKRFYFSSKESGTANAFSISESHNDVPMTSGLEKLGLAGSANFTKIDAQDAIFRVDGTEYTSSSNNTSVNGLNLTLSGTTADYDLGDAGKSVTVNTSTDVEAVYNNFKSFIKEYNSILKEMNELYYAGSSKGYDPLTADQKKDMSEKDIENWEKKIKDSVLRRDSKLGTVLNAMKSAMQSSVTVGADSENKGGTKYSLASFGVMTSTDYKEKGLLHMFGDSEDGVYASKEDKLKKALTENPSETAEALQGIMNNLYSKMTDAMKGTSLSSAMTFYNDKEITQMSNTYKKEYNTLEAKLNKMEDKYYKQFAAMEKAMAKLNSQNSRLSSMLGN